MGVRNLIQYKKGISTMMDEKILPDVQNAEDTRGVTLNKVGITDVDYPMYIQSKTGQPVLVYAKINLFTSLVHSVKGTNMSRLMEVITKWEHKTIGPVNLKDFLTEIRDVARSKDAYAEIRFQYFLKKETPVTKLPTSSSYDCMFTGHVNRKGSYKVLVGAKVLATSVCPCSKEMSLVDRQKGAGRGAHNQRSEITISLESSQTHDLFFEDIIPLVEKQGSCEIYNLLKRPDEKYVTEQGYLNPKFVEDIARDVAKTLQGQVQGIKWFKVKVENFESIHRHNACAYVMRGLKGGKWVKSGRTFRE